MNTAGIPWANVQALRRRGVDAQLVVFNRYALHSEADRSLERRGGLLRQQATQFSHECGPPLLLGTTWSIVSARAPQ